MFTFTQEKHFVSCSRKVKVKYIDTLIEYLKAFDAPSEMKRGELDQSKYDLISFQFELPICEEGRKHFVIVEIEEETGWVKFIGSPLELDSDLVAQILNFLAVIDPLNNYTLSMEL